MTQHQNNNYWTYYNKEIAIDCGIVASAVFTTILKFINKNTVKQAGEIAYFSSPVAQKKFPEFTTTQIKKALHSLQDNAYIVLKNNTVEVKTEFDYLITLTAKGEKYYYAMYNREYMSEKYTN